MTLKTEQNTRSVETSIRAAARALLGHRRLQANFEHGHWWITDLNTGAQWSVFDAEGCGSVCGFGFELVTEGEETP